MKLPKLAEIRKLLVYVVGVASEISSLGLLHGNIEYWVSTVILIVTGVLIHQVPNEQSAPTAQK